MYNILCQRSLLAFGSKIAFWGKSFSGNAVFQAKLSMQKAVHYSKSLLPIQIGLAGGEVATVVLSRSLCFHSRSDGLCLLLLPLMPAFPSLTRRPFFPALARMFFLRFCSNSVYACGRLCLREGCLVTNSQCHPITRQTDFVSPFSHERVSLRWGITACVVWRCVLRCQATVHILVIWWVFVTVCRQLWLRNAFCHLVSCTSSALRA